jgi:hypothetical protein
MRVKALRIPIPLDTFWGFELRENGDSRGEDRVGGMMDWS